MKNLLIASAVASALLSPVAAFASEAPTVYGNFRWTAANTDNGTDTILTAVNNASRLGVKGAIGGDSGLTGFYHMQMGAQNDGGGTALSSRFYFAGVKGSFGKVSVGRASIPYKMASVSGGFDPFYDTSAGPGNGGSSFGLSNYTNGFQDNFVGYYGKSGAVNFNAALILDGTKDNEHATNFGAKWSSKGTSFGAQVLSIPAGNTSFGAPGADIDAVRIHGTMKMGKTNLSLSFENIDRSNGVDGTLLFVGAKMNLGGGNSFQAQIGSNSGTLTGAREAEGTGFALGYTSKLAKKTTLTGMFSKVDYEAGGERGVLGVMLVQSF